MRKNPLHPWYYIVRGNEITPNIPIFRHHLDDENALVEVLQRVSHLAADLRDELAELDLNPLVILPAGQGAMVVDALLVRRER